MSTKAEAKPCPLCGKPPASAHAPFCSRGCKDRDLLQWLGEGYRIPGPRVPAGGVDRHEDDV
ncbi:MAG TPA: DNA gyrase inhibitor YacG [Sphingomicrobium sp.]|nr:DNA gyrase inhibitor YacG [Sphingomicrobium sp.]